MHLVIFVEEPSARNVLEVLLPQVLPEGQSFQIIPHQGKTDLHRSLRIKLPAWLAPDTHFVVIQDQDANDCKVLKRELLELCASCSRDDILVRIACYELESWYFGDLAALAMAYPGFNADRVRRRAAYRKPDNITKPSRHLQELIPSFQKGEASRTVPAYMDIDHNNSPSFQALISGLKRICSAEP